MNRQSTEEEGFKCCGLLIAIIPNQNVYKRNEISLPLFKIKKEKKNKKKGGYIKKLWIQIK